MTTRDNVPDSQYPAAGSFTLPTAVRTLFQRVSQSHITPLERALSHTSKRNLERARQIAAQMGDSYLGHPSNRVQRIA